MAVKSDPFGQEIIQELHHILPSPGTVQRSGEGKKIPNNLPLTNLSQWERRIIRTFKNMRLLKHYQKCPAPTQDHPSSTAALVLPASALLALLPALLLLSGCASYQIGNQSLYPMEVHTVYVPMFESVSFRRNLGERLTEAVMKEIELKTPYKVVSDPNADSVLSGRIIEEGKHVLIGSRLGDPRELQVGIRVEVSWVDRQGKMLRETSAIPLPSEIIDVQGTGNFVPEVGQSVSTAQLQAIQRIAEQIVSLMEKSW